MTYQIVSSTKDGLKIKIQAIKDILDKENEKLVFNGWYWKMEGTIESILDKVVIDSKNNLMVNIYFNEMPLYQNNYHGIPNVSFSRQ